MSQKDTCLKYVSHWTKKSCGPQMKRNVFEGCRRRVKFPYSQINATFNPIERIFCWLGVHVIIACVLLLLCNVNENDFWVFFWGLSLSIVYAGRIWLRQLSLWTFVNCRRRWKFTDYRMNPKIQLFSKD